MKLKQALLNCLLKQQLKELCAELDVEADRRSQDAMVDALTSARRATPEYLVEKLSVVQLRNALELLELSKNGGREELVERLLASERRVSAGSTETRTTAERIRQPEQAHGTSGARHRRDDMSEKTEQYRHADTVVQRPDVGVQDQFQAKRPPRTYQYDSSLDPAMSWDESRERDLGDWLLGLLERSAKEGEKTVFSPTQEWQGGAVRIDSAADAVRLLRGLSKPYLNWAGKAERHQISVPSVPLFVHERHSTKAILDGIRHRKARGATLELFGDPQMDIRDNLEAYEHKGPWQNRMILGDSLSVMNSLVEFEGLGGQVQMIYIDPPYGVKFGSNFQPFVRKREVKHGGDEDMTREPEMVKAYRDTWELGLHSYLTYLRDRLMVARELLHETGSVFVQISDENVHRVKAVLDEVFGSQNACAVITLTKAASQSSDLLASVNDYLLWFAKDKTRVKYRRLFKSRPPIDSPTHRYICVETPRGEIIDLSLKQKLGKDPIPEGRFLRLVTLTSQSGSATSRFEYEFEGKRYRPPGARGWSTSREGLDRVREVGRMYAVGTTLMWKNYHSDFAYRPIVSLWDDIRSSGFGEEKLYVVQTQAGVVERCVMMTTDPGDLVLDPTCGSGTTAYAAEYWGRRWITIDTSRVPLALARQRLLTSTFPYYELKEPKRGPAGGFVYRRKQSAGGDEEGGLVPHVTLKSIANNEPPVMEVLVDRPEVLPGVTRVSGPFVVEATIAPVQPLEGGASAEGESNDAATHLARMTEVLRQSKTLRLPGNRELTLSGIRRTVDAEYLNAEANEGNKRVAVVFGPPNGAVSASLVYEAAREAHYRKYDQIYFFGFAVEPNARSMIEDEKKLRIPASYVAVTPDVAMSDLLKTTRASEIFSITGLPDFEIKRSKRKGPDGQGLYEVELAGLDIFDPESLETESIDGQNVPCWMLDTDYDGMSFYATQVFFPRTSAWDNLQKSLKAAFDESVWAHLSGTVSEPFAIGGRKRVAVKVIDERGNELLRVKEVTE